jgi:hypothetical protein
VREQDQQSPKRSGLSVSVIISSQGIIGDAVTTRRCMHRKSRIKFSSLNDLRDFRSQTNSFRTPDQLVQSLNYFTAKICKVVNLEFRQNFSIRLTGIYPIVQFDLWQEPFMLLENIIRVVKKWHSLPNRPLDDMNSETGHLTRTADHSISRRKDSEFKRSSDI